MDLEELKNIDSNSFQKALQIVAILGDGQIINQRQVVLKESIDEYESYAQINLSLKSLQSIKTANKPLLKFFSPIRPLNTITQHDIEKFITQLKKTAPKGYKVYVRTIRAMFNKFKEWNYITNNPLTKIKFAKTQIVAPKYLTNDEFEKIMQMVESELIEDFCRVAFDTGMRLSEIVYLRWLNVNLKKRIIVVGDELFLTKTRKQRTVPMSESVFKVLEHRDNEKRGSEYVFGKTKNRPYTADYFSKKFKEACRAAEIDEGIHMHSLRHSAATRMAQSGAPIIAVKEILGHSSISTTMIYAHTDLEAMRAAVNLLK